MKISLLAEFIGEDNLLIGSDYGHNDPAEEKALVQTMQHGKIYRRLVAKIKCENPKRFYGLCKFQQWKHLLLLSALILWSAELWARRLQSLRA